MKCICENTEDFDITNREAMEMIARQCIRNHVEDGHLTWEHLFKTHEPHHWCQLTEEHSHRGGALVSLGEGLEEVVKERAAFLAERAFKAAYND